ncbi:MAG: gliding motility-associated C-terminal domain-containing protein, partial [Cytophagaceae bacterium]
IEVASTGTYWAEVRNECEVLRDEINVTFNTDLPSVDLGEDLLICEDFSMTLDAGENPGSSYLWLPAGHTSRTLTVHRPDRYIVHVSNGCGSASDTLLIRGQLLEPFGRDVRMCELDTIELNAQNPGASYLWSTGESSQTIKVIESGKFYVHVENECGYLRDTMLVSMDTLLPQIDLGPDIRECAPAEFVLDAGNPGADFVWSTGETSRQITVSSTGNYSVECINGCGSSIGSIQVKVDQMAPELDLGPDVDLCLPFAYPIDAGFPDAEYRWYPGGATSQKITARAGGTYSCVASNSCGLDSAAVIIAAFRLPQVSLGSNRAVCNELVVLNAGNPDSRYIWYPGGETEQTIEVNESGEYRVNVYNVCGIVSNRINVVIDTDLPDVNLGSDTTFCNPIGMELIINDYPMANISWSTGEEQVSTVFVRDTGTYEVRVVNACGESTSQIYVGKNMIEAKAHPDTTICFGEEIKLFADNGPYSYTWEPNDLVSNPDSSETLAFPEEDMYFYLRVNDGDCYNVDSVFIGVHPPIISDIRSNVKEGYSPLYVEFSDRFDNGYSYTWYFTDSDSSIAKRPIFSFEDGAYEVKAKIVGDGGCYVWDTINIKAFSLFIPNLITPDGDGVNDFWELTENHEHIYVEIYNRWGELVYSKHGYVKEWGGDAVLEGVYYYLVRDVRYRKEFKGWLHVLKNYSKDDWKKADW